MDVILVQSACLHLLYHNAVENVIQTSGGKFRIELKHCPLELTDVFQLVKVQIIKSCIFNRSPNLLVIEFCLKTDVEGKFNHCIEVETGDHFQKFFSPILEFTRGWIALPRLRSLEKLF